MSTEFHILKKVVFHFCTHIPTAQSFRDRPLWSQGVHRYEDYEANIYCRPTKCTSVKCNLNCHSIFHMYTFLTRALHLQGDSCNKYRHGTVQYMSTSMEHPGSQFRNMYCTCKRHCEQLN